MTLITILIPLYNVGQYLAECLDSILRQTYKNIQVVMVDDGSTDNTLAIARQYCQDHSNFDVIHQENKGVAAARNELLKHVKGDFALFIDGDDWIEPEMVAYMLDLVVNYNCQMAMCDMVINYTSPSLEEPSIKKLDKTYAIRDFLRHEYFRGSLCNKLISSNLLTDVCFPSNISYGEDALFCWNILQKINGVVVSNRPLYHYRMNEMSISHSSFGNKKYGGHLVWLTINEECKAMWPEYLDIAQARWAVEDTLLIRDAAHVGYPNDEKIKGLQEVVKQHYKKILSTGISTKKMFLYAMVVSHFYSIAKYA